MSDEHESGNLWLAFGCVYTCNTFNLCREKTEACLEDDLRDGSACGPRAHIGLVFEEKSFWLWHIPDNILTGELDYKSDDNWVGMIDTVRQLHPVRSLKGFYVNTRTVTFAVLQFLLRVTVQKWIQLEYFIQEGVLYVFCDK